MHHAQSVIGFYYCVELPFSPLDVLGSYSTMALGYAWFDCYDSAGYVLTLHISPPYILPIQA